MTLFPPRSRHTSNQKYYFFYLGGEILLFYLSFTTLRYLSLSYGHYILGKHD